LALPHTMFRLWITSPTGITTMPCEPRYSPRFPMSKPSAAKEKKPILNAILCKNTIPLQST
jgi:hypothetical protein